MMKHIAAARFMVYPARFRGYPARFRVYPATFRGYLAAARFRGHLAAAMCFSIRSNIFQQYIAADYSAFAAYVCLRMLTYADVCCSKEYIPAEYSAFSGFSSEVC